ncbi:MAG: (2Fe-2S)-binding protein [Chloroflexota bacterium]
MSKVIQFKLNGQPVETEIAPHEMALDVLYRELDMKSMRATCGIGICGACTILVDGETMSGCIYLAGMLDGKEVTTIEGFGTPDNLDPIQEAFLEKLGFQCSYCTPGMILTTKALLAENPCPSRQEIKEYMAGNLCRCGSYNKIIESIQRASELLNGQPA